MSTNSSRLTVIGLVIGLVVGLIVGWMVLGWILVPVEWTDAAPVDLHRDYRAFYVQMVADSYALDLDRDLALTRLGKWDTARLKEAIADAKAKANPQQAQRLDALAAVLPEVAVVPGVASPTPGAKPAQAGGGVNLGTVGAICGGLLLIVLLLAGIGFLFGRARRARQAEEAIEAAPPAARRPAPEPVLLTEEERVEEGAPAVPPLGHWMTSYSLGNDSYDESFSIETPVGEFLGECGVGISETIGAGPPSKVTAFEIWLFDKNDIRTVTKVLMSAHAFNDEALRTRLEPKGEAVLCQPNKRITLETASLRVEAVVSEMEYGTGSLPPQSFFNRLTVELAVWAKPEEL
ncbi:MAG: hypothetical protein NUW24_05445 [Anaerolineae bacterium]|jgi:uncharacterized protein YqgC (DUF456 family)|nr:hypothetical protein [Anaerolineae bacterium]MDH7474320.1 hypothetical protein [Anaerolineae bacterium]